jgi:hypothetical protein
MLARRFLAAAAIVSALHLSAVAARAAEPHVVATTPVRHAFAPASTAIAITFDQPLLPSSITSASLRVFGRSTGPVSGAFVLSNADHTVTITPSHAFSAGETVLVNLSHDVRAADSTSLRSAGYAFEFVVATKPATRDFAQIDEFSNRIGGAQTRIYGAVAADLNHDGWIDLGTVNEVSADVRVFLNRADGSGLYQPFLKPPFPVGVESSPNDPADFDNDGKIDIVVSATDSGGVWIARGNGDGTFGSAQTILTGSEPHGVAVLDVDGDGDMDIVEAIEGDSTMAVMLNDGSGAFGAPTYFDIGCGGEWGLAAGDMNNDGITDLVVGCVNESKVAVLLGNGDATFTALTPQDAGGQPWQVALGDLDGDGDLDVTTANATAATGGMLRNNGDGTLAAVVTVPMPGHTPATDLGDLDGDGDLDWVLSSYGAGLWRVYVNDGNGNFTFDQDIAATSNPSCAVLLDIDNDGDLDLALSDEIADTVKIMQNGNGPSALCPPTPAVCRTPFVGGKATLLLKDKTPDKGDQLVWKWLKGPTTSLADYGTPLISDSYALCLYDAGALLMSADADAGGMCGKKPCWSAKPTSFAYKNRDASTSGTQSIQLKQGLADGKASIVFQAKGAKVVMPNLGALTGPVVVQLQRSGGAPCFGATYSAPFQKSDAAMFKDKAD